MTCQWWWSCVKFFLDMQIHGERVDVGCLFSKHVGFDMTSSCLGSFCYNLMWGSPGMTFKTNQNDSNAAGLDSDGWFCEVGLLPTYANRHGLVSHALSRWLKHPSPAMSSYPIGPLPLFTSSRHQDFRGRDHSILPEH